jgi:hypothetical protein
MAQIAPFCISSKEKIPDPLPLSRIMACTLLSLSYVPVTPAMKKCTPVTTCTYIPVYVSLLFNVFI